MYYQGWFWTKGYIYNPELSFACAYTLKTIDDKKYLFVEYKDNRYIYMHEEPSYLVFEKLE